MDPNDHLDELLNRWSVPPAIVPDLRPRILRELEFRRQNRRENWMSRIEAVFSRPSFAVTFVAACVLLGLFLAEQRVARLHARYGAQVAREYVQLIDPLLDSTTQVPAPAAKLQ